eukprot:7714719-Lingulodinium_polyedra.AAC.1
MALERRPPAPPCTSLKGPRVGDRVPWQQQVLAQQETPATRVWTSCPWRACPRRSASQVTRGAAAEPSGQQARPRWAWAGLRRIQRGC